MLNRKTSNMYSWVDKTRNFLGGSCPHQCNYCYVKSFKIPSLKERYSGKLRLLEKELAKPEGSEKMIFVCSCNDLFADAVPNEWINKVLLHCNAYPKNIYLFQSKNPLRFLYFYREFPKNSILGTTIETNFNLCPTKAPQVDARYNAMIMLKDQGWKGKKMCSLEPLMDFDLDILVSWIKEIQPESVSIGADSKEHNLPEPSTEKVLALIEKLSKFTKVIQKKNLNRLTKKEAIK